MPGSGILRSIPLPSAQAMWTVLSDLSPSADSPAATKASRVPSGDHAGASTRGSEMVSLTRICSEPSIVNPVAVFLYRRVDNEPAVGG